MFNIRDISDKEKERVVKLEEAFSKVRRHFPLKEGFLVRRPSEDSCKIYDWPRFRKVVEFSFGIPGTSYFTLMNENIYSRTRALTTDLIEMGLETTLVLTYESPNLVLKPQW